MLAQHYDIVIILSSSTKIQKSGVFYHFVFVVVVRFKSCEPFIMQWKCRSFRTNGHWLHSSPTLLAQVYCLQETFLKTSDFITLSQMSIYRLDRLDFQGSELLTTISLPLSSSFLLPLPLDPRPLGVSVFLDQNWISTMNIYSPEKLIPDSWLSGVTSSCGSPLHFDWVL